MATTYKNLDIYMMTHSSKDKINEEQIDFGDYHSWTGTDLKVFTDPIDGSFHILKDMIFQIAATPIGGQTTTNYYKSNTDLIFKNINSYNYEITILYADYRVIKFYTVQAPDKYLGYTNFDDNFNYNRTYSVSTYPWIKLDTGSYRDRRGDWDLNGNASGEGNHNQIQALCRSLKEAYKINGESVWPGTYEGFIFAQNHDTKIDQGEWKVYPPTLTNNINRIEVDRSNHGPLQIVYQWPQLDYRFGGKYITSCDIKPIVGTSNAYYQFSSEYKTRFADNKKPNFPERVEKMGFTSLDPLGKILQKPVETFNQDSIKSLEVSWADSSKKTCNITAHYDNYGDSKKWTKIPKKRTLGIRIRLPGDNWRQYGKYRVDHTVDYYSPVQLPWGVYNTVNKTINLYSSPTAIQLPKYNCNWTWDKARQNRPWYSSPNAVGVNIQSKQGGWNYIPQLKIKFTNKYYYAKISLENLLTNTGANNSVSILFYTGEYKSEHGVNYLSFNGTKDGNINNPITISLTSSGSFSEQYGWKVNSLKQVGHMNSWDSNSIYRINGQKEFDDFYSFNSWSDSSNIGGTLHILNNIDLFTHDGDNDKYGGVETIETTNFGDLFHVPNNQLNGWITPCEGTSNYITLDWSYNLVLKNRLLPYTDDMFLPITDWTQRHYFNGTDTKSQQNLHMFANNKDTNKNRAFDFGYTVGVRVYNASNYRINNTPLWDKPLGDNQFLSGKNTITIRYNKDNWNKVNDPASLLGAYRYRNSMAWQFEDKSNTWLNEYFTDESHLIAPPVGLVLE